jgi:HSP20 family protein
MAELKEAPRPRNESAKGEAAATDIERRPTTGLSPWVESPFAFLRRFAEEIDQVFDNFGLRMPSFVGRGRELLRREVGLIPAEWSPRVDVSDRDGKLFVRADLPGLSRDDVQVDVTEDRIEIRGERKREKKEEREGYSYSECSYGSFYRAIPLPEGADASKATAEFRNGVLEVIMPAPRRPVSKARRLEIHEKK